MARSWLYSKERIQTTVRVSRPRCRAAFRSRGDPHPGIRVVYQRLDFEGRKETSRLHRIRQTVHTGTSSGRNNGVVRRCVRGVLRLSASRATFVGGSIPMSAREAILRKVRESIDMKQRFFEMHADKIDSLCREMARRFRQGQRLYVMGNGGSACDALHTAVEFKHPIIEKRRPLPAEALMADVATISAISNDQDFSRVFANQLRLFARPEDMALAISTSGKSPNLIYGLEVARERGLMTIAFAGKDGGRFPDLADHCLVVPSFSIHRIQEVHVTLIHVLWDLIHVALGEEDVI